MVINLGDIHFKEEEIEHVFKKEILRTIRTAEFQNNSDYSLFRNMVEDLDYYYEIDTIHSHLNENIFNDKYYYDEDNLFDFKKAIIECFFKSYKINQPKIAIITENIDDEYLIYYIYIGDTYYPIKFTLLSYK